ncbi:hypothetical protein [Sinomonas atrocyanea]|uniref:hypothetical protein n=1 Tax=Sinomonas atrocyanea TaxID=37927 RepID=UPI003D978B19
MGSTAEEVIKMRWLRLFKPSGSTRLHWSGVPTHGMGRDTAMPNLAAAQNPGPGVGHVVSGDRYRPSDDAADPVEKEGHDLSDGSPKRRWGRRKG